VTGKSS